MAEPSQVCSPFLEPAQKRVKSDAQRSVGSTGTRPAAEMVASGLKPQLSRSALRSAGGQDVLEHFDVCSLRLAACSGFDVEFDGIILFQGFVAVAPYG